MQVHATAMSVSEFLRSVANQERAGGNDVNAEIYDQRAEQARTLEAEHAAMSQAQAGVVAELEDLRSRLRALAA